MYHLIVVTKPKCFLYPPQTRKYKFFAMTLSSENESSISFSLQYTCFIWKKEIYAKPYFFLITYPLDPASFLLERTPHTFNTASVST